MLDTLVRTPPEYLLGAGLTLGLAAWLVARGFGPRHGVRVVGRLPLMVLATLGGLAVGGGLWLAAPYLAPFVASGSPPVPTTCAQARAMGYGTARIGQPGYFAHLDADRDGISCEPRPRWMR